MAHDGKFKNIQVDTLLRESGKIEAKNKITYAEEHAFDDLDLVTKRWVLDNIQGLSSLFQGYYATAGEIPTTDIPDGAWALVGTGGTFRHYDWDLEAGVWKLSGGVDSNAVHYTAETKTDPEKAQARLNIGALGGSVGLNQIAFGSTGGSIIGDSTFTFDSVTKNMYTNGRIYLNGATTADRRIMFTVSDKVTPGIATFDALSFNFNASGSLKWSIQDTGVFQSLGAQTIQTSAGLLTLQPAGGISTGVNITANLNIYSATGTGVIRNTVSNGSVVISGGNTTSDGGNIALYGSTHATTPNLIQFRTGAVVVATIGSNQLNTITGTAALPSISFISDPDTGIYSAGANLIGFSTGGVPIAQFAATGLTFIGSQEIKTDTGTLKLSTGVGTGDILLSTNDPWAVRITGNRFQVGIYTQGGSNSHLYNIWIPVQITGGVSAGALFVQPQIKSDVTGAAYVFRSGPYTEAAPFTLGSLTHFNADTSTFGAGSVVTNQYGFYARGTLTAATNNFAFRSDIAEGTGRWNLYMAGTAQNYLAGNLMIGATDGTDKLDVNGTVRVRSIANAVGNFVTLSATNVFQQRTPAQVLTDIGAAPVGLGFVAKGVKTVAPWTISPGTDLFATTQNLFDWLAGYYAIGRSINWTTFGKINKPAGATEFTMSWLINNVTYVGGTTKLPTGAHTDVAVVIKATMVIRSSTNVILVLETEVVEPLTGVNNKTVIYADESINMNASFPIAIRSQFSAINHQWTEQTTQAYVY